MVLGVQAKVPPEALLGTGVQNFVFDGRSIRGPVNEDHFANGHLVLVCELEVEGAISILFLGKSIYEFFPCLSSGSDLIDHLTYEKNSVRFFSFRS